MFPRGQGVNRMFCGTPAPCPAFNTPAGSMTILHPDADRIAFVGYLRRGTPRGLSLKQAAETGRYVRHRRRNDRVRPAHRMNDGRIFSPLGAAGHRHRAGRTTTAAAPPFPTLRARPSWSIC